MRGYDGKTLDLHEINESLYNCRLDNVIASIRGDTSVQKVHVNAALRISDRILRKKVYNAIFLNPRIREISVRVAVYGAEGSELSYWLARALREMNIDALQISYRTTDLSELNTISQAIRANRSLKELEMDFHHYAGARIFVANVAKALRFRHPLTCLSIVFWPFTTVIQLHEPILSALVRSKTVKKLELAGHIVGNQDGLEFVEQAVTRVIQENTTLKELTVDNHASDFFIDVAPVLHSLNANESLTFLRLSGFCIRARNYTLANHTVKALELNSNEMDPEGVKSIVNGLLGVTALKHLDFSTCGLDDITVGHVCKVLEDSGSVDTLILYENEIGDDGCIRICEALKQNEALSTLDISHNEHITDTGATLLIESVKTHPALTSIVIDGNTVSDAVKAKIQYYLDLNKGPKTLLNARVPLPLSLWHRAFKRADNCRRVTCQWTNQGECTRYALLFGQGKS